MKKLVSFMLVLVLSMSLFGCGKDEKAIIIQDSQLAEGKIIHQAVKMLVEENTDLKVTINDEMTPVNNFNDMVQGNSDIMNSYDGTVLSTFLKKDVSDVPKGTSIYDYANQLVGEQHGLELLAPLGHENTYGIAVTQETADKYKLETISDLIPVSSKLTFGAEHEFFSMEGSMKYDPFVSFYGLSFKEGKPIDLYIKYNAIESGNIDVTVVYSTDGLNKKSGLKVLKDDQNFFPEYNGSLLVRKDMFEKYADAAPNLKEVLNILGGQFDNETMSELTYKVDVEGQSPEAVAKEFLESKGLIGKK